MTEYLYKCVAAPRRPKRRKGDRSPAEALAGAMEAIMAEQAAAGWEYLRCDTVPVEARAGLFSAMAETHQSVMVFRRPRPPATQGQTAARLAAEPPALGAARLD